MKKGIILLITLSFITVISLFVLKNLSDTDKLLKEVSLDSSLIQFKITHTNIQKELTKIISQYIDEEQAIDKILELTSEDIILNYGDMDIVFKLESYGSDLECNLNEITDTQSLFKHCSEETIANISYQDDFLFLLSEYKKNYENFNSKEQIDYFLKEYIRVSNDDKIITVQSAFNHFKAELDVNGNPKEYLKCSYTLSKSIKAMGEFIFEKNSQNIISFHLRLVESI